MLVHTKVVFARLLCHPGCLYDVLQHCCRRWNKREAYQASSIRCGVCPTSVEVWARSGRSGRDDQRRELPEAGMWTQVDALWVPYVHQQDIKV